MVMLARVIVLGAAVAVASAGAILPRSVSSSEWSQLNKTVGGRLSIGTPLSLPCFSTFDNQSVTPDPQACAVIEANYTSPTFRVTHFGAYMLPQWETCQSTSQQCLLDDTDPSDPLAFKLPCSQGSIPPFYIDVQSASDIQAAFAFSKSTGVSLTVKNGGHDYKGRSSRQDSLGLWTRNLKSLSYSKNFVPEGCKATYNAITTGAGGAWEDLYAFADANNVTIIGAYHQTVGASGGWMMGGGHSILSPNFGLGVDRVVQTRIVTPDGQLRVANECQNTDLFWALRGGGGGTFGVVIESTHKVEPRLTLQVSSLAFNKSDTNMAEFYQILLDNSLKWGSEGWGGHIQTTTLIYVTPNLSLDEATASMKPMTDFIHRQNGTVVLETLPSWNSFFLQFVTGAQAAVGPLNVLTTRLIPKANFETEAGKAQLLDLLVGFLPNGFAYIPVVPPVLFKATEGTTSVTPAWRDALWHLAFRAQWKFNSTVSDVEAAYASMHNQSKALHAIAPNSGAYFNEGDVYESDHETSYWGPNYPRLLQIKNKYDPHGLLDCWQCVGWKGASAPDFACYLPSPQ